MRYTFIVFLLFLIVSCVPDNLYLKSPEIYQKPKVGAGFLESRISESEKGVRYPAEIYNLPLYFSYGKVYHSGWGVGLDIMLTSFSFLNIKLVTPKKYGFFAALTAGLTTYYLPYSLSMLIGKEVTKEILLYGGISTSDLFVLYSYRPTFGNYDNFRFAFPLGIRTRLSNRIEFVSEIILPVISDEALFDKQFIAYPRFGSAFFFSLK
jgi:hypothetical protein